MTTNWKWRGFAALMLVAAGAACSDDDSRTPSAIPQPNFRRGPAYLQQGNRKVLNLPTETARQSVAYKDPVQGTKDANGQCRFNPDINTMRIGLTAILGEWDTVTCSGLLYYFKPGRGNPRKPDQTDTTFLTPTSGGAQATYTGAQACSDVQNNLQYPPSGGVDSIVVRQALIGQDPVWGTWDDSVGVVKAVAYGGHIASDQYNGGCARINTGYVLRSAWDKGSYRNYRYSTTADSTVTLFEPQQAPVNPGLAAKALLRSATRFFRISIPGPMGYCDPAGHPVGMRYSPSSDSHNHTWGLSTMDIGWWSNGSHYTDWGMPLSSPPQQYGECDDVTGWWNKVYGVTVDKNVWG